jgi:type II secretory pathway predicted ATPase ExeA
MGDLAADRSGLLVYEPFYGLHEKPFSLSTDPRFLYQSSSHSLVYQQLLAGIRRREGLVVLTGAIGMGKTTLCRSVLGALDRTTVSAFVPDPFLSRDDLLKSLLVEFGVVPLDDLVRGRLHGASRAELSYPLYEFLRSLEPLDAFAVLLIDEAQHLPDALLEEVRILSDLEGTRRLLQVVLIGQPELSLALREPHMRQIQQRVTTHSELQPLDRDGVYGYVGHRLTVAGASAARLRFSGEALDLVFAASGGVPRVINRLCDRTLQRGYQVRTAAIGPELVQVAIADLQLAEPVRQPPVAVATSRPQRAAAQSDPVPVGSRADERMAAPRTRVAQQPLHRAAIDAGGAGGLFAVAALIVLGALTGLTLASYWLWAGPVLTDRAALPRVPRPSMRIRAPLPAVLEPAIESMGDAIAPARPPDAAEEELPAAAGPPRAVTTEPGTQAAGSLWVVQVAAFADEARASSLVARLAARGFTAFTNATTRGTGTRMYLVLVGPYAARAVAASTLDRLEEVPGVDRPMLQAVPPAASVR